MTRTILSLPSSHLNAGIERLKEQLVSRADAADPHARAAMIRDTAVVVQALQQELRDQIEQLQADVAPDAPRLRELVEELSRLAGQIDLALRQAEEVARGLDRSKESG